MGVRGPEGILGREAMLEAVAGGAIRDHPLVKYHTGSAKRAAVLTRRGLLTIGITPSGLSADSGFFLPFEAYQAIARNEPKVLSFPSYRKPEGVDTFAYDFANLSVSYVSGMLRLTVVKV